MYEWEINLIWKKQKFTPIFVKMSIEGSETQKDQFLL